MVSRLTDVLVRFVRNGRLTVILLLMLSSPPALAQHIPLWVVAGVLSPALAMLLLVALAIVAPGVGRARHHLVLFAAWIVLFLIASNFVTNDWVIWTPMHLYILHLALLSFLVFHFVLVRFDRSTSSWFRDLAIGLTSLLISVPTAAFVTCLSIVPLDYLEKATGMDVLGKELPRLWCFILVWVLIQALMLVQWRIRRFARIQPDSL